MSQKSRVAHINRRWAAGALGLCLFLSGCGGASNDTTADQMDTSDSTMVESTDVEQEVTVSEAALRMAIVDETSSGVPENFEVWVKGTGSWFYAQDSLLEEAGPFSVGGPASFFVYPQGRDGEEIEVMLDLPQDVIPASVQHMITITVFDDEVVVSGTSVPGFEEVFQRS